ncbi:FecR domain-containing protein [Telmatobacter sp. DSM 110680]|uniref:FecR domain-containing protein n=1 Tax=Telmatobacter sp. DSM 110680 TaxID=3036704 RepID=A0AAU7DHB4_9BACT
MNPFIKVWLRPAASVVGLALFLASGLVYGQQADPNVRAARLSDVEGDVQLTEGSQILANPALVNTPLFEGVQITTKDDGRAELQFDDGSVARISPNSSLKIAVLRQEGSTTHAELDLQNGLAYFEFQGDASGSRTIARFGDSSVTATGFTVVRVNLDNLPGELAVFSGNAHLQRGKSLSLDLHGGESVALNAADPSIYNLAETIEPDSWDAWNADRDQELTSQLSAKTAASGNAVNSNNPAWGDLDANGNWYNVPGEGYVWSPLEAASGNWDPYGCGNWVWTPQFGYVWVSCEQWGYLPYMSGSWNYYDDFGWGWQPGYGYPWWETGSWGWNIGNRPYRYQPPHRPHGGPVKPPGDPIRRGGFYQPNPVLAVNRGPSAPTARPVHPIGRPVTIAGNTVAPLKPLMPRPPYSPLNSSGFNRPNPGYAVYPGYGGNSGYGVNRGYINPGAGTRTGTGYVPWANSGTNRSGSWTAPAAPGGGYHPSAPAPSRGYSGAGAPSSHVSSGGGGGGGGHVSSGGGGGGGGGHAGGGGGASASGGHH